jgi:hypothetical protein
LPRPQTGIVQAHSGTSVDGPVVASATAGVDGAFAVRLPVGAYVFTAGGARGEVPCVSQSFSVGSSSAVSADVICDWD